MLFYFEMKRVNLHVNATCGALTTKEPGLNQWSLCKVIIFLKWIALECSWFTERNFEFPLIDSGKYSSHARQTPSVFSGNEIQKANFNVPS